MPPRRWRARDRPPPGRRRASPAKPRWPPGALCGERDRARRSSHRPPPDRPRRARSRRWRARCGRHRTSPRRQPVRRRCPPFALAATICSCASACAACARACASSACGLLQSRRIVGVIDLRDQVALLDPVVVLRRNRDDETRHPHGDRDDVPFDPGVVGRLQPPCPHHVGHEADDAGEDHQTDDDERALARALALRGIGLSHDALAEGFGSVE